MAGRVAAGSGRPLHATERRARSIIARATPGVLGDREQQRFVGRDMVEHAGEERRIGGGLANRLRADACGGEERAQALGVPGEEARAPEIASFSAISRVIRASFAIAVCLSVTDRR